MKFTHEYTTAPRSLAAPCAAGGDVVLPRDHHRRHARLAEAEDCTGGRPLRDLRTFQRRMAASNRDGAGDRRGVSSARASAGQTLLAQVSRRSPRASRWCSRARRPSWNSTRRRPPRCSPTSHARLASVGLSEASSSRTPREAAQFDGGAVRPAVEPGSRSPPSRSPLPDPVSGTRRSSRGSTRRSE